MSVEKQQNYNIIFLGYGYIAQCFCKYYSSDDLHLSASINNSKEKYFKTPSKVTTINFLKIDHSILDNYDNFVISIPPFYQRQTDIVIDKFHDYFLSRKTPYKLIYLSATSVYGDHEGRKVQEDSDLKAKSKNGLARISCENNYLALQENALANIVILRLAAIYGDQRNSIVEIRDKNISQNKSSNRMISRTHAEDITAIIKKVILSSEIKNQIFNISDNNPCPTNEVNDYICEELLKINKLPIEEGSKESKNASFAPENKLDNKVVDNSKLKRILNYELTFPSYKEGLQQVFKNLNLI
jgi:dTDP-4-dehydrorhamnose reductase